MTEEVRGVLSRFSPRATSSSVREKNQHRRVVRSDVLVFPPSYSVYDALYVVWLGLINVSTVECH